MRRVLLVPILFLSACAAGREDAAVPERTPAPLATDSGHRHGRLVGMNARELGALFGTPALQVREGPGLKLQYRGGGCVLDAYLYPPSQGTGTERVTYVDARRSSGTEIDRSACEAAIEAAR